METRVREENEKREQCVVFPLVEVAFHGGRYRVRIGKSEGTSGLDS